VRYERLDVKIKSEGALVRMGGWGEVAGMKEGKGRKGILKGKKRKEKKKRGDLIKSFLFSTLSMTNDKRPLARHTDGTLGRFRSITTPQTAGAEVNKQEIRKPN